MSEERGFMDKLKQLQESCLKMLIQPERMQYFEGDLGGTVQHVDDQVYSRNDFAVKNRQGFTMHGTYFERGQTNFPKNDISHSRSFTESPQKPAVLVYCHSQTGNRMEGYPLLSFCAANRIDLVLFDFAGCGLSEGQYVSLGWFEPEDLKLIIDHIKANFRPRDIFIWGRSMGAVAAIRFTVAHPLDSQALVLDSPFGDLMQLAKNIAIKKLNISSLLLSLPLLFISKRLTEIFGVNLLDLRPQADIAKLNKPTYFISCKEDDLLPEGCVAGLYKTCPSNQKVFAIEEGNHNSERADPTLAKAVNFISKYRSTDSAEATNLQRNIKATFSKSTGEFICFQQTNSGVRQGFDSKGTNFDPFLNRTSKRGTSNSGIYKDSSFSFIMPAQESYKGSAESKNSQIHGYNPLRQGLDKSQLGLTSSGFSFNGGETLENPLEEPNNRPIPSVAKRRMGETFSEKNAIRKLLDRSEGLKRYSKPFHERRINPAPAQDQSMKTNTDVGSSRDILNIEYGQYLRDKYKIESSRTSKHHVQDCGLSVQLRSQVSFEESTIREQVQKDRKLSLVKRHKNEADKGQSFLFTGEISRNVLSTRTLMALQYPHQKAVLDIPASPLLMKSPLMTNANFQFSESLNNNSSLSRDVLRQSNLQESNRVRHHSPLMMSLRCSSRDNRPYNPLQQPVAKQIVRQQTSSRDDKLGGGRVYRPFLETSIDKENVGPNML